MERTIIGRIVGVWPKTTKIDLPVRLNQRISILVDRADGDEEGRAVEVVIRTARSEQSEHGAAPAAAPNLQGAAAVQAAIDAGEKHRAFAPFPCRPCFADRHDECTKTVQTQHDGEKRCGCYECREKGGAR